jgi:hypothetical protein
VLFHYSDYSDLTISYLFLLVFPAGLCNTDCGYSIQHGLDSIRHAVEDDSAGRYPEALRMYQEGLEYFVTVIKCKAMHASVCNTEY